MTDILIGKIETHTTKRDDHMKTWRRQPSTGHLKPWRELLEETNPAATSSPQYCKKINLCLLSTQSVVYVTTAIET